MAHFRRTFLFLREVQKHFSLQENTRIDVDRECYTSTPTAAAAAAAATTAASKRTSLPGRRLECFHLIGELTALCRCFESDAPVPIKVFIKVCSTIPITVRMDKELLITFLVNVMFQSVSNIRTFPQVHANTSDRLHEIVLIVTQRARDTGPDARGEGDLYGSSDHFDSFLDITVLDTGLNNVLTQCGLLAGEGFQTEQGMRWSDGNRFTTCGLSHQPPIHRALWATVYVQLQEYLFRAAVQRVGGSFNRCNVTRKHSSYLNEVSVSLPLYDGSTTSRLLLLLPAPSASNAAHMMSTEYSQYRDITSYYQILYDKMAW